MLFFLPVCDLPSLVRLFVEMKEHGVKTSLLSLIGNKQGNFK